MSVWLALAASVGFGLQTLFVRHGLSRDDGGTPLVAATVTLLTSLVLLAGVLAVRRGVPTLPALAVVVPFVVAGVLDPGASRLLFFEAIDRVGPSIAAAVTASSPAVATVVAVALLGERVTAANAVGVALVVLGVAAIQFQRPDADDGDAELDAVREELRGTSARDLAVPLGAAVVIALSFVLVKFGLDGTVDTLVGTTIAQLAAVATLVPLAVGSGHLRRYAPDATAASFGSFVGAGVFVGGAWYAMFRALDLGSVVTVLPVVSTYPLVVVAATYALARERPKSPVLLAAVVAIVVGAAAVQLG